MLEAQVEGTICNRAEAQGWVVRKLKWIGRVAAMDHFFLKGGRIVLIEFKRPDKEPNVMQGREIDRFRDAGAEVYVIDNIADGMKALGLK